MIAGRDPSIISVLGKIRGPAAPCHPKLAAAQLAMKAFGEKLVMEQASLVNFAALWVASEGQPSLLSIRGPASRLIASTDLHSLPDEPPKLLRGRPVVLQAAKASAPLFGETMSLACYELDGARYLIGLTASGSAIVSRWNPEWTGEDLAESARVERSPLVDSHAEYSAWAVAAAQYIVTLGVLLDSENCPLSLRPIRRSKHPGERGVYYEPREAAEPTDLEGLSAQVWVVGHLKRQRHGPGRSKTRWIWVAEYSARRWVSRLAHSVDTEK